MRNPFPESCRGFHHGGAFPQLMALSIATAVALLLLPLRTTAGIIVDHHAVAAFDSIPASYFQAVRDNFPIFYGHTSHGSQLVSGMEMLEAENGDLFISPQLSELSGDLGHDGDLTWAGQTREYLDGHAGTEVVMWSWCGGCSDNTDAGIDTYLNAMTQLENDYPSVLFIYMTGHLDGTGEDGLLRHNNNRIRDYCLARDKVLFDFADIESWSPDGIFHPDETDACGWCESWCAQNDCPTCAACAHSHCFNCYRKGRAFWWMMARIAGWQGVPVESRSLDGIKALYRSEP
jgi:hypothetical protein